MGKENILLPPEKEPIRVLVVEDSALVQKLLRLSLDSHPDIMVAGTASNGEEALQFLSEHSVEVILLDIEMPVMDGMTALPRIIKKCPKSHVIMCSTLTRNNAEISLRALELGATDIISKPSISKNEKHFTEELIYKVLSIGNVEKNPSITLPIHPLATQPANDSMHLKKPEAPRPHINSAKKRVEAIAIGCSTGGPNALKFLFNQLCGKLLHIPVFITQHMPASFIPILAENLTLVSHRPCVEAQEDMEVMAGTSYIAPGDYHMQCIRKNGSVRITLSEEAPENFCRPAVDPMLRSLAEIYKENLLTIILTGMGHDGLEGCKTVHKYGGTIVLQDEDSSVVWGMPGAVANHHLSDTILPLQNIASYIEKYCEVEI